MDDSRDFSSRLRDISGLVLEHHEREGVEPDVIIVPPTIAIELKNPLSIRAPLEQQSPLNKGYVGAFHGIPVWVKGSANDAAAVTINQKFFKDV